MTPGTTSRVLTRLAMAVSLAITLLPPLGYFLVQHEGVVHSLETDSKIQAVLVSNVVGRNSKIWMQAHERLLEAIEPVRDANRTTLIIDDRGHVITAAHAKLKWPTVAREDEFFDFGIPAGHIQVVASLADVVLETVLILAFSAALGFLVFVPLRKMPIQALKRASESIMRGELDRSLVDGLSEGVVLTDDQLKVIASNRSAEHISGVSHPIIMGASLLDCFRGALHEDGTYFPPEQWPMRRCLETNRLEGPVVMRLIGADGREISLAMKARPILHGEQNEHRAVVISIEDITQQKRTADQLILTERAVQSARDAIFITDFARHIISTNEAFCGVSLYEKDEVLGQKFDILRSDRHQAEFCSALWEQVAVTGAWAGEIWIRRRNGEDFPAWLSISEVRDQDRQLTHYICTLFDITERMEAEQQVRHLAQHDSLTGLPNRVYLRETLGQSLAAAQRHGWRVGVFFIDIDHFKLINDTKGHRVGDLVLGEVARRLKAVLRIEDTVGRLAGDEFVIVIPNVNSDSALVNVAENILQSLSEPFVFAGDELLVTMSIGIVIYPNDGMNVDSLLSNADTAMYAAKSDGRANYKFFTEAMNEAGHNQLEMTRALKNGLERGEFVLYYQPQVDAKNTRRILGAEALIRWNHPERGTLAAGQFIYFIEGSRLIIEVGEWVLDQALQQAYKWRQRGLEICISVNISPLQFRQENFIEGLRQVAARHAFVAGSIRLEITESLMLTEPESTIEKMNQIRELGFLLSLDDFGTGYSSLAYLARFPFDELKIDRSFVCRLTLDKTSVAIVDAVIVLSHALGLQTVAEGVETDAEADILRRLGCDQIQGYLHGRPMPAVEFEQRLCESTSAHSPHEISEMGV